MKKDMSGRYLNAELLIPAKGYYKSLGLREITSLNIFKPSTTVFDENGLFSTEIFGPTDSEIRFRKNGYIDFRLPVFHPFVFKNLISLGEKYKGILSGDKRARFDKATKDFILDEDGETGFKFFLDHLSELKIPTTDSDKRDLKINLVKEYGMLNSLYTDQIVMSAGLREYTIDAKGSPSEDEINTIYRRLIYISQNLKNKRITPDIEHLFDGPRYSIQLLLLEIYEYIKTLLDGKKKFIQGSWSSRGIDFSTRNVVSATSNIIRDIDVPDNGRIDFNTTLIGLFQFYKCIYNIGVNRFHNQISFKIFDELTSKAYGFNKDTFKVEKFDVDEKTKSKYTSLEGFDSLLNNFNNDDFKFSYFEIKNRYAMLKLEEDDKVEIFFPMLGIREGVDIKKLQPVTYIEAFYIAVIEDLSKFRGTTTRYPIANYGSTVPNKFYIKSTVRGRRVKVILGYDEYEVFEYPMLDEEAYRSMGPHITHLKAFTMDFDGDMGSCMLSVTKEGNAEVDQVLNDKNYYLDPKGKAVFSVCSGMFPPTLKALTK